MKQSKWLLAATLALGLSVVGTAHAKTFLIGLSNGYVGSAWRTQMIKEAQEAAKEWKARGVDVKVLVQSANVDVQGQIAQVQNFINRGVNAIIVDPNSPTAFDPVFAQAKRRGILVVATDAEVSSKDAIYVGINQKVWAEKSAKWLAEALHGKGRIVCINGIAGNPANQMRVAGYKAVFSHYPGIRILNQVNANWNEAQGQQAMQNLLATYGNLNGVWVQDGMAFGAWRAIMNADKLHSLAATGEIRKDFIDFWHAHHLESGASVNPPGVMASALNVAVWKLLGHEFKKGVFAGKYGNAIYVPVPFIDNKNLNKVYQEVQGKPGYYSVTTSLSIQQAKRFFR